MRRFNLFFKAVLLLTVSLSLYACKSDTVVEPEAPAAGPLPVRTVKNLAADTAGTTNKFTYFRFSDSTIVTGADTASNKWDIAFKSTTIIINGGAVRFGSGGAIVQRTSNFDTVSIAPESGWGVDTTNTNLAIRTGSGNGWYSYDFTANMVTPILGTVLHIRTGDGKYAKVEIISYYKDGVPVPNPNPTNFRWYNFRYVYQPNGSRSIK